MEWTERGAKLFACSVVMVLFAAVAVLSRFISRRYIHRVWGLTDWCIVFTLLFSIANTVGVGLHISHGLGHHVANLSRYELQQCMKMMWANIIIGSTSLIFTKLSVLLLFLDVFVLPKSRKATYIIIGIVTAYGTYLILSNIFFCTPVNAFWDWSIRPRKCLTDTSKYFVDAACNIALDFIIFCLPIPVVRSITLPWRQKLWLYVAFALGLFVCIVSVTRLYFLYVSITSSDKTFVGVHVAYWSTIEMNVAIVIACIPTLKPLVTKMCPRLLVSTHHDSTPSFSDGSPFPHTAPPTISSARPRRLGDSEVADD
ncbi:hypothetical protein QBC35DRAFT_545412 [Podospora australis]|uniref:Rhodopsin domain-containing protein n=1 Tax=Podospora australis TaxID=1536484 RepID=A0AAN6WIV2_9PEZI|nr:hypothetical protein QBC35DRAFT_545412 [Podospora australis]